MGSELIIPGTPTILIPSEDRPVFDASLQNGYAGLAMPAPASVSSLPTGVTKEVYAFTSVSHNTPNGFADVPNVNDTTLAAGNQVSIRSLIGSYGTTGTLVVQALGAVTSGAVIIGSNTSIGHGINVTKAPGGTVIIPNWIAEGPIGGGANDTQLQNTDAASQLISFLYSGNTINQQLFSTTFPPSDIGLQNLFVNRADVLRIRELMLIFFAQGFPSNNTFNFSDLALLRILTQNNAPNNNYPVIAQRSLQGQNVDDFQYVAGLFGTVGLRIYHLPTPLVLNGTDVDIGLSNAQAPSWQPTIWVEYKFNPRSAAATATSLLVRGVLEVFRGLNQ